MSFTPELIRNVAVLGHQGSGKTTLVESLAYKVGLISEKGTIEKKNTISDYLMDEKKKQISISSSIVPLVYNDHKINLIDVPGNDDFIYETIGITRLIKGAILVIDASRGVQIGTVKHFNLLKKRGVPIFIYINKMDKENVNFTELYEEIVEKLDKKCVPFSYPIGRKENFDGFVNVVELKARKYNGVTCEDDEIYEDKRQIVFELHNRLCEAVATTDDALLEKFFSGEELSRDEIRQGLRKGVLEGELYPIIVGSAAKDIGINTLLTMLVDYLPSPADLKPYVATDEEGNEVEIKTEINSEASLYVFKNSYSSYQGLTSIFKVNSGVIKVGDEVYCPNNDKTYRISTLFEVVGEKLNPVTEVSAGDIGATTKLEDIRLSYTLCSPKRVIKYKQVNYPTATYFKALDFATKADSDKFFPSLEKIMIEDPSIELRKNQTTNQILVGGLSSSHLAYVFERLKNNYKINFTPVTPKIVYKETITKKASAEGRYIKQSGGSGYYGVVNMDFEPAEETSFGSTVFGGHIDKGYFPAVEKGFNEALQHGQLVGAPVINVKATLTDGKQHSVDSNEMAFKNAAIIAFKDAYMKCGPILLEPFDKITVNVSNDYLGAVLSDLSKRRGKIQSSEEDAYGNLDVVALVPEAEIQEYANELKAITKSTAFFNLEFYDYEKVPDLLAQKIIEENKK
ncbi:MAG: elongation factor G [Bacilli bacterium]|nr:elongation factor G [Bacilli bacterium]MDY4723738.1 elongation factor G [Bacilli bacterium]MDY4828421.1 elongation factor G [Bacilli bacterium]